jgi:hypothetical protein
MNVSSMRCFATAESWAPFIVEFILNSFDSRGTQESIQTMHV